MYDQICRLDCATGRTFIYSASGDEGECKIAIYEEGYINDSDKSRCSSAVLSGCSIKRAAAFLLKIAKLRLLPIHLLDCIEDEFCNTAD